MKNEEKGKIVIPGNIEIWDHEFFIAKALANAGHIVEFYQKDDRTSCPDAYIDGVLFEFKSPQGRNINSVERNLKRGTHQSQNIVLCSARLKRVQDRSVKNFLAQRLRRKHGLKKILFVDRQGNIIDINKLV